MSISTKPRKPLGRRAYGSIVHLPQSRLGPGDHRVPDGQGDICTRKVRDSRDRVIVTEKLDGSNVAIANIDGTIVPLVRAGYRAETSPWKQHHIFAKWVMRDAGRFTWIPEGWRLCGEWLAQAHSTRYSLPRGPFVAFDLMREDKRMGYDEFRETVPCPVATVISDGPAVSVEDALRTLGMGQDGAMDEPEGVVYRVERDGTFDFMAKYVRPDKVDGLYLPEISGKPAVWNWQP